MIKEKRGSAWIWIFIILIILIVIGIIVYLALSGEGGSIFSGASIPQPPPLPE